MPVSSKNRARAFYAAASTLALGAGALALPVSAFAQNAPKNGGTSLSEVVVTAQKRSENLQKIPVAVTAFTAQVRDKSGLVSAQQQMNFTPGVTYDPSTDHLDIRGVGRVTTYIGTDPGVAVYQDGFYVGTPSVLNATTLELERTEVLRGPQGTLYGRNSIGGAVNAISRRPDDEYTGDVRVQYNDWQGNMVEARVSGPVTDWLKLSAYVQENSQTKNYFHNVPPHTAPSAPSTPAQNGLPALPAYPAATCDSLNFASVQPLTCQSFKNSQGYGGPGHGWVADFQATFTPNSSFDAWVRAYFSWQYSQTYNEDGITTPWDPIPLTVPSVFYGFQGRQQPGLYDPRAMTGNYPFYGIYTQKMFITQDTWHASGFDVKLIAGYWKNNLNYIEDGDAVPDPVSGIYVPTYTGLNNIGPIFNPADPLHPISNDAPDPFHPTDNTVVDANNLTYGTIAGFQNWSTELNIASTEKGPLQWLFGLYYYSELNNTTGTYQVLDTPQYNYVTDYLFQKACLPVNVFGALINPANPPAENDNPPIAGGPGAGGSCGLQAISPPGTPPLTVASAFGYNPAYGGGPSTVGNINGAVDKLFGIHNSGPGSDFLYAAQARLKVQSQAIFAQLDWRPNDQWHVTLGGRYSWDEKQGYEQEMDIFWSPLVATQAQAAALGFPTYPSDWPIAAQRGTYVTDYVGTSCSAPGTFGIQPLDATHPCPAHRSLKASWQAPTGTVGVEWTPTPETNVYVRYNRGYKSGGFNLGPLAAPGILAVTDVSAVKPEFIDDFEGGWKQNFGHNLQFDIAAFYYLYHDLQALNATQQNSSPPIQINELINIQDAKAWGVEFEGQWSPIENLLLAVNYSYLGTSNDTPCTFTPGFNLQQAVPGVTHAENCFVDSANPAADSVVNGQAINAQPAGPFLGSGPSRLQGQSLKGNVLPYSPQHKVSFNGSYTFKFEPGDLTFAAVYNWHSSFYDNLFTTPEWLVPSGDTADFRVTWSAASKRYQIIGSVTNAFNKNVLTAYSTLPPGNAFYAYNALQPPRIFTVELRYHF
jgi:outer membrane receptor protein involved in Fe transport